MLSESKSDKILARIKKAIDCLNASDGTGNHLDLLNGLKFLRYFLALQYALSSAIFTKMALAEEDRFYFTMYRIAKIGNGLGLDLDESRQCLRVFTEGIKKGEILHMKSGNTNYYTLDSKGEKTCKTYVDEILSLIKDQKLLREANAVHTKLNAITKEHHIAFETPSDFRRTTKFGFRVKPEIAKLILKIESMSRRFE